MKLNKAIKCFSLTVVMLIMFLSPTIAGCFSVSSYKLETPVVTIHNESLCLTWDWVRSSKKYEVYCNDKLVDSVASSVSQDSYLYEFGSLLTELGEYKFHIVAIASSSLNVNSDKSNEVSYTCSYIPEDIQPGDSDTTVDTTTTVNSIIGIAINGTRVDMTLMQGCDVDGYELYLYSNSTGLNTYPVDISTAKKTGGNYNCSVDLLNSRYGLQDEIYAVRIGYVLDDKHVVNSEVRYINPDNHYPYTNEIYLFDGKVNDMYIENLDEFRNVIYYSFINRDTEISVMFSKTFSKVVGAYSGYNGGVALIDKIYTLMFEAFNYFMETRDGYSFSVVKISDEEYSIRIRYDDQEFLNSEGKPEPELTLTPPYYAYEDIEWDTFYDTCGYTMRDQDEKYSSDPYDDFASDKQFLYTTVSSSEQLYWAVENKITPKCVRGSRADIIYTRAKTVLNSIISDDMNDYEKALSIFDWINDNTSYDYYSLMNGAYNGAATLVPVYYLEGVFLTGYAVCDGFSKAFSLMCNMEGLDALRVVGYVSGGGHAWNKVGIDMDPTDNKGAQYYVVDITWTEVNGSRLHQTNKNGNEATSHEFFLVDDDYIKNTHTIFEKRERYTLYKTGDRYDYYNNTKYTFDPVEYGATMSSNATEFDLVINSEDDLTSIFYYMLVNNRESIEVVIDYNFIKQVDIESGGYGLIADKMYSSLIEFMRSKKFLSQYVFLNHNSYLTTVYNEKGDLGLIIVLENNILIDDVKEVGHLVEFLSHYKVYGNYEIYVDEDILNSAVGYNETAKINNLFASSLANSNINMKFTQKSKVNDKGEVYYTVNVSPKVA